MTPAERAYTAALAPFPTWPAWADLSEVARDLWRQSVEYTSEEVAALAEVNAEVRRDDGTEVDDGIGEIVLGDPSGEGK